VSGTLRHRESRRAGSGSELVFTTRCVRCGDKQPFGGQPSLYASISHALVYSHLMTGVDGFAQYWAQLQALGTQPLSTAAFRDLVRKFRDAVEETAREDIEHYYEYKRTLRQLNDILAAADGS
jgi:hypothetical protein